MPLTTRLYPYELSTLLQLVPDDPFDPTQEDLDLSWIVKTDETEDDVVTMDVSHSDATWRELRFGLDASLPQPEIARVLAPGSSMKGDAELVVTMECARTKLRRAVVLSNEGQGHWRGDITVRRSDVREVVTLTPKLVRTRAIPGGDLDGPAVARQRNFLMAVGRSLRLIVDPTERRLKGVLDTKWEEFRVSDNPWRKSHSNDVYHLDVSDVEPTLWLNEGLAKFRAALHGHQPKGGDAVIRKLGNATIAQSVWLQLFMMAIATLDEDEDGGIVAPREGWKRAVLQVLLSQLFVGVPEDERMRKMFDMKTGDQAAVLLSELGTAAQQVVNTKKLVSEAISAAETV